jgi:hypothetical protein
VDPSSSEKHHRGSTSRNMSGNPTTQALARRQIKSIIISAVSPTAAMAFWPPNAPTLFSIAVDSAKRITSAPRAGGHNEALVSVVFAAASLEAFLNESVYLAENTRGAPPIVSAFAQVMADAEESKAQIQSKFQFGSLVLSGKTYEKGAAPYQDFSDLIAVRNSLMHGKSNELFLTIDGKPGGLLNPVDVIGRLTSKNILHEAQPEHQKGFVAVAGDTFTGQLVLVNDSDGISPWSSVESIRAIETSALKPRGERLLSRWTYVIGTKAVAQWACDTASRMATDLMDKAPSPLKQGMESYFRCFVMSGR